MDAYVGTKIITAELSTLEDYKKEKYGENADIKEGDDKTECYIIVYPPIGDDEKPYISMSPKNVFEYAYRKIHDAEKSLIFGAD